MIPGLKTNNHNNNHLSDSAILQDDLSILNNKVSSTSLNDTESEVEDDYDDEEENIDSKVNNMDIVVLARSGAWYRLQVGKNGGECKMVEHRRFDRKDGWD